MRITSTFFAFLTSILCFGQVTTYVHTATPENISEAHITVLSHPLLDGNPDACLTTEHRLSAPGTTNNVYNDNEDGLWYNGSNWTIFNEDIADMVQGASFNVIIADQGECITHTASAGNSAGNWTDIDDPSLNDNNPGPYIFVNNYWNPSGVYNTFKTGSSFNTLSNKRSIFTQDQSTAVAAGTSFKVMVNPTGGVNFGTHVTTAENISNAASEIDNPNLNGNPNAIFAIEHYWGIDGAVSQVWVNANLGVWYSPDAERWYVYTENLTPMPQELRFDFVVGPESTVDVSDQENEVFAKIYPNPARDLTKIVSDQIMETITILDITGKEVFATAPNKESFDLEVSSFQPGIYMVLIQTESGLTNLRLVRD